MGYYSHFLFGTNYIAPVSTVEHDYRLQIEWDRQIIRDVDWQSERVELTRWIIGYISSLGDETPWIEGYVMIKMAAFTFAIKFWCLLVRFRLCPASLNNMLLWNGSSLVASMAVGYDINFVAIIQYEIHKRDFDVMITLSFPCLIQILSDDSGVPEISGVDEKVKVTARAQTKLLKDSAHSPTTILLA